MGRFYTARIVEDAPATTLKIGFGAESAQNDLIVPDAIAAIKELGLTGGTIVRLDGPASLPVAIAIAHELSHLYGAVAALDPKIGKYVVAVAHGGEYVVGQLLNLD